MSSRLPSRPLGEAALEERTTAMRNLVVGTFLTVDGVMQAPGGPDEDREGGFEHGGWSFHYWDDDMGQLIVESTLLQGDVAEAVARLKEEPGDEIQVAGSGELAQTLIEHDLVDEYRLWVFPLVLGEGTRLFARGTIPAGLKLVDTRTSTTGVAIHTYERAGEVQYGSFA